MIYWITGKAGSGKTTLANEMAKETPDPIVIDGDELRQMTGNDLGFSADDRRENARRAYELARFYESCGKTPIVAMMQPPEIPYIIYLTGGDRHEETWQGHDSYQPPQVWHEKR